MSSVVLVTGACGSGKTTAGLLARDSLAPAGTAAYFDVDWLYQMIDPQFSISFPEAEASWQAAAGGAASLTASFITSGLELVVVSGNGLFNFAQVQPFLKALENQAPVWHVTLDPRAEVCNARIRARNHKTDAEKPPEWVHSHVAWMRERYEPWTVRIDNSDMTPQETVRAIGKVLGDRKKSLN